MKSFRSIASLFGAGALLLTASVSASPAATTAPAGFSSDQVKQIQQIVHDYLVTNPNVLVEASEALQKQEMAKVVQKAQQSIMANANAIFNAPGSPVLGNAKGDVTVVEFFDYQCPHCKDMEPIVSKLIQGDSNLRVVLKELPIFGGNSKEAALAALAAYKLDPAKFGKFHEALMVTKDPVTPAKIMELAKQAGYNVSQLQKQMKEPEFTKEIQDNFKLAQDIGIMGTPSFVIGKTNTADDNANNVVFVPGATTEDALQQAITKLRS